MATPTEDITELTVHLRTDATEKLKMRAAASGQDIDAFVSQLLEHFAQPPTPIEELSGSIHQRFLDSGISDELERARHEMRADRRARHIP
jgi:hypothetical protein